MEKEKKKRRVIEISEKVDMVADILSNDDDDIAIARLKALIKKREENKKAREAKKVEKLLKVIETVSYKKILKEIAKSTKDKHLIKGLTQYQINRNEENAKFLENIKMLLNTGEEADIKKVYELLNLDYEKIQKEIEEERLKAKEKAEKEEAEKQIQEIEGSDEKDDEEEEFNDLEENYTGKY